MSREGLLLQQIVATVAAVVPTSAYDGTKRFEHVDHATVDDRALASALTRRFHLETSGEWSWAGDQVATAYGASVTFGLELVLTYRRAASPMEFCRVVLEDVRGIYAALVSGAAYGQETTGMWQIEPQQFDVDPGAGTGDMAVLTMPLLITYNPE